MARNIILTETGFKNIYRGYLKYIAMSKALRRNCKWME